mgnify:CR=1 FL=1
MSAGADEAAARAVAVATEAAEATAAARAAARRPPEAPDPRYAKRDAAVEIFRALGWEELAWEEIAQAPLGDKAQRAALLAGLKNGDWQPFGERADGTFGWHSPVEADRERLALLALRVGVPAPRAAVLIEQNVDRRRDQLVARLAAERGETFAATLVARLSSPRNRFSDTKPTRHASASVTLAETLGLEVDHELEWLRDWACVAADVMQGVHSDKHGPIGNPPRELLRARFGEHAAAAVTAGVSIEGPLAGALHLAVQEGWLTRGRAVELGIAGLDAAAKQNQRRGWLAFLEAKLQVTDAELAAHAEALLPALSAGDGPVTGAILPRIAPLVEVTLLPDLALAAATVTARGQRAGLLAAFAALPVPPAEIAAAVLEPLAGDRGNADAKLARAAARLWEAWGGEGPAQETPDVGREAGATTHPGAGNAAGPAGAGSAAHEPEARALGVPERALAAFAAGALELAEEGLASVLWPLLHLTLQAAVAAPRTPPGAADVAEAMASLAPQAASAVVQGLAPATILEVPGLRALAAKGGSARAPRAATQALAALAAHAPEASAQAAPAPGPASAAPGKDASAAKALADAAPLDTASFRRGFAVPDSTARHLPDGAGIEAVVHDPAEKSKQIALLVTLPAHPGVSFRVLKGWYYDLAFEGQCQAQRREEGVEPRTVFLHWDSKAAELVVTEHRNWVKGNGGPLVRQDGTELPPWSVVATAAALGCALHEGYQGSEGLAAVRQMLELRRFHAGNVAEAARALFVSEAVVPTRLTRLVEEERKALGVLWPLLTEALAAAAAAPKAPRFTARVLDTALARLPHLAEATRRGLIPAQAWEPVHRLAAVKGSGAALSKARALSAALNTIASGSTTAVSADASTDATAKETS